MSKTNDGGPAFPTTWDAGHNATLQTDGGMSLRDWFAGKALAGEIAATGNDSLSRMSGETTEDALAREAKTRAEWCYRQADAMLAARSAS